MTMLVRTRLTVQDVDDNGALPFLCYLCYACRGRFREYTTTVVRSLSLLHSH